MRKTCKNCKYIKDIKADKSNIYKNKRKMLTGLCSKHNLLVSDYHLYSTKCGFYEEVRDNERN